MGNLWGDLNVSLVTPQGRKPLPNDKMCIISLLEKDMGASAYFGGCALEGDYEVDSAKGTVGKFKGCPEKIAIENEDMGYEISGSCAELFPMPWSNKTLRRVAIFVLVFIFGLISIGGILHFYRHQDSSDMPI